MVHRARWSELSPSTAYELLQLRCEVFVVEQACAYLDVDGRDVEPTAEHRWVEDPGGSGTVVACLRVIDDRERPGVRRIGRVVCRADARGKGLSGGLVRSVVDDLGGRTELTLSAQAHLADWYRTFGFEVCGPHFVDDGILHVPMMRPAGAPAQT
jgi:ElaA protein